MNKGSGGSGANFVHLGDQLVYRGHLWKVVSAEFRDPSGETFTRDIVRSPGAVGVVAVFPGQTKSFDVVLVRQYRAAFDDYVLEIPAGMRDVEGEDPEATAHRELMEETGYRARSLELLHVFYPSPGMTDAALHIYLGTSLVLDERNSHGPEELDMEVLTVPIDVAVEMAVRGEIRDAKSVIGLLLAQRVLTSR